MAKTVYSLLLGDDIVAAVDALAAREGYSRSALVNHILAEHLSLTTAAARAQQIANALQTAAQRDGLRASLSPGGTLTLRTALRYKYNPALFYVVELDEAEREALGQLRVGLRSQNASLLAGLQRFFALWSHLEQRHLQNPPTAAQHTAEEKRYLRTLRRPKTGGQEEAASAIAAYVALFDACIKTFFDYAEAYDEAAEAAAQTYLSGLPHLGRALEL